MLCSKKQQKARLRAHSAYRNRAHESAHWTLEQLLANARLITRFSAGNRDLFPVRLHFMLESVSSRTAIAQGLGGIIRWMPHGRAFRVCSQDRLASELLPLYLKGQTKYASFLRQLNIYGFTQITGNHADRGAYYHEYFLRGLPLLCEKVTRLEQGKHSVRQTFDPHSEPSFYQMEPLPSMLPGNLMPEVATSNVSQKTLASCPDSSIATDNTDNATESSPLLAAPTSMESNSETAAADYDHMAPIPFKRRAEPCTPDLPLEVVNMMLHTGRVASQTPNLNDSQDDMDTSQSPVVTKATTSSATAHATAATAHTALSTGIVVTTPQALQSLRLPPPRQTSEPMIANVIFQAAKSELPLQLTSTIVLATSIAAAATEMAAAAASLSTARHSRQPIAAAASLDAPLTPNTGSHCLATFKMNNVDYVVEPFSYRCQASFNAVAYAREIVGLDPLLPENDNCSMNDSAIVDSSTVAAASLQGP